MTDHRARDAFLDLVDGRGAPHAAEAGATCPSCEEARARHATFEREFDQVMRSMASQPLPPSTLTAAAVSARRPAAAALVAGILAILAIVGVAVALPGRGDTGEPDPSAPASADPAPSDSPAAETELDRWRAELPRILERTTPFQAEIIGDGIVTDEEHDRAQDAYLQCVRDEDIVVGPRRDKFGLLSGLTLKAMDPNVDADEVNTRCAQRFYSDVSPGRYVLVIGDDTEEDRVARLAVCLTARGYDMPMAPESFDEIRRAVGNDGEAVRDLGECSEDSQYP